VIEAIPTSRWFNDFEFRQDGRVVGEMRLRLWRRRAVVAGGERYPIRSVGFARTTFELTRDGQVLASAVQPSARRYEFWMELGAGRRVLRFTSIEDRRLGVFDGDAEVGSIRRESPGSRHMQIALPSHWPLHEQLFVFWLAVHLWERESASHSV
jgi:hypothetical protein